MNKVQVCYIICWNLTEGELQTSLDPSRWDTKKTKSTEYNQAQPHILSVEVTHLNAEIRCFTTIAFLEECMTGFDDTGYFGFMTHSTDACLWHLLKEFDPNWLTEIVVLVLVFLLVFQFVNKRSNALAQGTIYHPSLKLAAADRTICLTDLTPAQNQHFTGSN